MTIQKVEPTTIVYKDIELADYYLVEIRGDKESVTFDLRKIINNDDGWIDGFELTWSEIYKACKEWIKRGTV